jgi:hypothetical protein
MTVFISSILNYSTSMVVDGATYHISFTNRGKPYNYGYYVCGNDKLAKALEKHPEYGKYFRLQEEKKVEPKVERVYNKVYEEVKRTQEANKILVDEYGVEKDQLKSKADALSIADKLNIHFPNLV